MSERRLLLRVPLCAALLVSALFAQTAKRPLNHHDYAGWRTITSQRLSPDGKFLAYGLFPQEGDGEIVIRSLVTGSEQREPGGVRPAPVPAANAEEGPPPEARAVTIAFSADSRTAVFSTFPAKAAIDQARKDKKPAPKDGMVIVDLASGKKTRIDRVKRFSVPEKAAGLVAYWKEGPDAPATPAGRGAPPAADQQAGGRGGRGSAAATGPRPEFGSDLVLRNLSDGAERSFAGVVEFSLTDDGKQLVYAVSARDLAKN